MLEEISRSLLRDVAHIALMTLVVGLVLHAVWRLVGTADGSIPLGFVVGATSWGRVRADLMKPHDLAMSGVLLSFFYLNFIPVQKVSETESVGLVEQIVVNFLVVLIMLTFVIAMLFVAGRRKPTELFGLRRLPILKVVAWVAAVSLPAVFVINWLHETIRVKWLAPQFGEFDNQEAVNSLLMAEDQTILTLLVINSCIVAPLAEEVLFRGYIYAAVKRYTGALFAMAVVGLLFAAVHLVIPGLVPLWVLAIVLTLAYEFSGSLWVPIGIHAIFNTVTVVYMLSMR